MIGSVVLYALNILGTLWLESTLTKYYKFELAVIVLLLFFAIVLAGAERQRLPWLWRASTLYFAASVLNITFLFLVTNHFLAFALTTLFSLVGLLRSVSNLDKNEYPDIDPIPVKLETYGLKKEEPLYVDPVMWVHPDDITSDVSRVRTGASKSTRKKSTRKSTKKKSKRKVSRKRSTRKSIRKKSIRRKSSLRTSPRKSSRKKSSRKKSRRKTSRKSRHSKRRR